MRSGARRGQRGRRQTGVGMAWKSCCGRGSPHGVTLRCCEGLWPRTGLESAQIAPSRSGSQAPRFRALPALPGPPHLCSLRGCPRMAWPPFIHSFVHSFTRSSGTHRLSSLYVSDPRTEFAEDLHVGREG